MPRSGAAASLNLLLNGRLVGRLRRQASGAIDFRYDEGWLGWEHAIPVSLSLPLDDRRHIGAPVIAVLDNLLPDNGAIRRLVAARSGAEGDDAYSLLARIGRDCVGALQFLPDGSEPGPAGAVEWRAVDEAEIAGMLRNLAQAPLGAGHEEGFRISLAGVQEKTALLRHEGRWLIPHGTTATTHILKPSLGVRSDGLDLSASVENEYLCLRLAEAMGLPSAAAEIAMFEDRKVLVVERFDRRWTRDGRLLRVPQEDFCQVFAVHPAAKYEADGGPGIVRILNQLGASDEPEGDRKRFLKTQLVFWLLGATDGHAKNFSLFLGSGGRFRLTPLYDVMSVQSNVDAGQIPRNRYKLSMAVGAKRHYGIERIAPRDFRQTASLGNLPAAMVEEILHDVTVGTPKAIDQVLGTLPPGFPEALAEAVVGGMRSRLRVMELDEDGARGALPGD